uniref:Tryptophan synthase alpha chain n=1 Tax=Bangiopsis subsimplex TaxID=139980 RepID=A0A1C9CCV9_9RHOD|nr:tryptophan synthase alpha subunit [Bangiopsis subsimplex]AOM66226.1 tryptophan synthase alpha subunit [Bangiopsis subsimplex]ARO90413.1 tryptophan synthase alpha subunit [Bangiopsis subsimplex]
MEKKLSISETFTQLKQNNKCAFIPFITAGDPNLEITKKALTILSEEGADIIEIGIPYSDPLADGPVIQEASARALKNGITLDKILKAVQEVQNMIASPLIAFTYYNIILNHGINKFVNQIVQAGFKGILVPDLPIEEIDILEKECKKRNLELILLIGPNSSKTRIKKIIKKAHGCLYLVSSTGVTGMKFGPNSYIESLIQQIKQISQQALIVGFGISTQDNIKLVQSWGVDGIVMGSSFVKQLFQASSDPELYAFRDYCQRIKHYMEIYK